MSVPGLRMSGRIPLIMFHSLLIVCLVPAVLTQSDDHQSPPSMDPLKQPIAGEMLFQVVERNDETKRPFYIECEARGTLPITYTWQKNGKSFSWAVYDDRISQQPDRGTLVISDPRDEDIGSYQCFARNEFGTAASNTVFVRKAVQRSFRSDATRTVTVREGEPLELPCDPPEGYPRPIVQWLRENNAGSLQTIQSPRMTVDPFGNLWFSNVTVADESRDYHYACSATSPFRNEYKVGNRVKLRVTRTGSVSAKNKQTPTEQYTSPRNIVAQRGKDVRIWCIYGGTPRPETTWRKSGDNNFMSGSRVRPENYGKSLLISDVRLSDTGEYTCTSSNGVGSPKTRTVRLKIQAKPRFTKEPEIVNAAEGEVAVFECEAEGLPTPEIKWIHNGRPINAASSDPRISRTTNRIVIRSLVSADTGNYGCNATNSVGYVYKDVFVNVQSLAPEILVGPSDQASVVGQDVLLACRVFGAPKPIVTWRRGGRDGQELTGGRYHITDDGSMRIEAVAFTDAGDYTCHAKNKLNEVWASGSLVVKERTRITQGPEDYQVVAGDAATFRCTAAGDTTLQVSIGWLAQGVPINFDIEPRFIQTSDNSLTITKTTELDSKLYTCVAETALDRAVADATLTVEAVPNPPILNSVTCGDRMADVRWSPDGENRAPILSYTIQYNTSFTPDTWIDTSRISALDTSYTLQLSPWANHTFRVIAKNRVGPSLPSGHSRVCTTGKAAPQTNPSNVQGRGTTPTNLVIRWTPMPMIDHNGPAFRYHVEWRADPVGGRQRRQEADWRRETITDWRRDYLLVDGQPTYQRYQIRVKAENQVGQSEVTAAVETGWSGEDVPTAAPENFRLIREVDGRRAVVAWNPVSNDTLRGSFKGYKVQAWSQKEGREKAREKVFGPDVTQGMIDILKPFSMNDIQVRVFNGAYEGPPSVTIPFRAKEGPPSAIDSLDAIAMGSSAFFLFWKRPLEANGILTGYKVQYQQMDGLRLGPLLEREPSVPNGTTRAKLSGLKPATKYRITVRALNGAGEGPPYYIERTTQSSMPEPPDRPSFLWDQVSSAAGNILRITWVPDIRGRPGSHFFVQYRRYGESSWISTPAEYYEDSISLRGLEPGQLYEIRAVSVDGQYFMHSDIQEVVTYSTAGQQVAIRPVATAGWFIALLLAVALLLLLLLLVCLVRRNRGAKYDVHDRELLHGAMDAYPEPEGFQEYEQPLESKMLHHPASIHSDSKHPESDIESVAEYADDPEEGMNEDGSFIGRYMGGRQQAAAAAAAPRTPDKVGTFV